MAFLIFEKAVLQPASKARCANDPQKQTCNRNRKCDEIQEKGGFYHPHYHQEWEDDSLQSHEKTYQNGMLWLDRNH